MKNWKNCILPSAGDVTDADPREDATRDTLVVTDVVIDRLEDI